MLILGYTLLFLGSLAVIICEFLLLGMAFKRSLLWFFGCLMFPILWFAFCILNPKITAKPLGMLLLGLLATGLGCHLTGIAF